MDPLMLKHELGTCPWRRRNQGKSRRGFSRDRESCRAGSPVRVEVEGGVSPKDKIEKESSGKQSPQIGRNCRRRTQVQRASRAHRQRGHGVRRRGPTHPHLSPPRVARTPLLHPSCPRPPPFLLTPPRASSRPLALKQTVGIASYFSLCSSETVSRKVTNAIATLALGQGCSLWAGWPDGTRTRPPRCDSLMCPSNLCILRFSLPLEETRLSSASPCPLSAPRLPQPRGLLQGGAWSRGLVLPYFVIVVKYT